MPRRRSKKPRGSRGVRNGASIRAATTTRIYHDLNVPLPSSSGSTSASPGRQQQRQRAVQPLLHRLCETGYRVVALSHTVYGRPRPDRDEAHVAIPLPSISGSKEEAVSDGSDFGRKRKRDEQSGKVVSLDTSGSDVLEGSRYPMTVLRRLSVVVEELADVGFFSGVTSDAATDTAGSSGPASKASSSNDGSRDILSGYDIVALSPRGEAAFHAACTSARGADVLALDYSRGRLPFRLRQGDVRAATELGLAFEICYGLAITDQTRRKFFVQAATEFVTASVGVVRPTPTLIVSSGSRTGGQSSVDLGSKVLRSPGDMINVLRVVLGLKDDISRSAMGVGAELVVEHGRNRRTGRGDKEDHRVRIFSSRDGKGDRALLTAPAIVQGAPQAEDLFKALPVAKEVANDGTGEVPGEDGHDGFITF